MKLESVLFRFEGDRRVLLESRPIAPTLEVVSAKVTRPKYAAIGATVPSVSPPSGEIEIHVKFSRISEMTALEISEIMKEAGAIQLPDESVLQRAFSLIDAAYNDNFTGQEQALESPEEALNAIYIMLSQAVLPSPEHKVAYE